MSDDKKGQAAENCMCSCHRTEWMCEECCDGPSIAGNKAAAWDAWVSDVKRSMALLDKTPTGLK